MTWPPEPARIAVLDVGKTNLKLLVASEDGWPLETHSALGAALLWRRFARTLPVSSVVLEAVTPLGDAGSDCPGLSAAYQSWIAFSEQAP
jgi:hypothetical protein